MHWKIRQIRQGQSPRPIAQAINWVDRREIIARKKIAFPGDYTIVWDQRRRVGRISRGGRSPRYPQKWGRADSQKKVLVRFAAFE